MTKMNEQMKKDWLKLAKDIGALGSVMGHEYTPEGRVDKPVEMVTRVTDYLIKIWCMEDELVLLNGYKGWANMMDFEGNGVVLGIDAVVKEKAKGKTTVLYYSRWGKYSYHVEADYKVTRRGLLPKVDAFVLAFAKKYRKELLLVTEFADSEGIGIGEDEYYTTDGEKLNMTPPFGQED